MVFHFHLWCSNHLHSNTSAFWLLLNFFVSDNSSGLPVLSPVRKLDFLKFTVSDVTNLNFQGYPCDISHRHFYRFGGFFFRLAVKIVNGGKKIMMKVIRNQYYFLFFCPSELYLGPLSGQFK